MNKRLALLLIAAAILLQVVAVRVVNGAYAYQSTDPGNLVTYGAILRRVSKADRWHFVAESTADESGHVLVGFTSVTCVYPAGYLSVKAPFRAVASAWTQPDETLTRRGISAGPSIANDDMRVYMYDRTGKFISCSNPLSWGTAANLWVGMVVTPN